jgi:hypothetical protein
MREDDTYAAVVHGYHTDIGKREGRRFLVIVGEEEKALSTQA